MKPRSSHATTPARQSVRGAAPINTKQASTSMSSSPPSRSRTRRRRRRPSSPSAATAVAPVRTATFSSAAICNYARTNEAVLERQLRHRAERYALDHPLYVAQVAFWTTVRAFELDGLAWAQHTASTVSIDTTWANRGVYCFWVFAVLAIAGAFTPLARRAPWYLWAFPA